MPSASRFPASGPVFHVLAPGGKVGEQGGVGDGAGVHPQALYLSLHCQPVLVRQFRQRRVKRREFTTSVLPVRNLPILRPIVLLAAGVEESGVFQGFRVGSCGKERLRDGAFRHGHAVVGRFAPPLPFPFLRVPGGAAPIVVAGAGLRGHQEGGMAAGTEDTPRKHPHAPGVASLVRAVRRHTALYLFPQFRTHQRRR